MTSDQAKIGTRVRSVQPLFAIPIGTEGVIDEEYSLHSGASGVMVAWSFPDDPLPQGYARYDGRSFLQSGILRDGFDKATELHFLEVVQ